MILKLCLPVTSDIQYNIQYNVTYFIAKCQYNCTRNVLWCHVHSSHIHANHKTSLNYNNSKQRGKKPMINKYMRNPADIKPLCITHPNCLYKNI